MITTDGGTRWEVFSSDYARGAELQAIAPINELIEGPQ
jgi:hypothetical protein